MRPFLRVALAVCAASFMAATCFAESGLPKFGLGVRASTLGIGVEGATAVSHRNNIRAGFDMFSYGLDFDKDGINYDARLKLRSAHVLLDQYLVGGLHLSPGFMLYNTNKLTATGTAAGGRTFSLGDRTYISQASSPLQGSAELKLGRAAPMLMIGLGNLVPRSGRHFTVNVEAGVVFQKSPEMKLNLSGNACDTVLNVCGPVMSIPGAAENVVKEQNKINDDLKPFKYYPIVSLGFGWSF
jgi:hypothetical protein